MSTPFQSFRSTTTDLLSIRMAVLVVLGMALTGLATLTLIENSGLSRTSHNVAFILYLLHEPVPLTLSCATLLTLWVILAKNPRINRTSWQLPTPFAPTSLALLSTAVSACGVHIIMHNFPLSMDEYLAIWQADALLEGRVTGQIPEHWRAFSSAITPIYVRTAADGSWTSQYLPAYAALLAVAKSVHAQWLVSPLLTGAAVLGAAGAARRLLPEEPKAPVVAALLLATSSQFLVTGMTYYAWQAHLAFNMIWLWLILSPRLWVFALAPALGLIAVGLHRPHVHAMFALPFLFRLVLQRQWTRVALAASIYLVGLCFWLTWMLSTQPGSTNTVRSMGLPTMISVVARLMNIGQFVSWQNIAALTLATVAILKWRSLSDGAKDLALGIVATFGIYLFFGGSGGHGWGARYMHSTLGNFALLGTIGLAHTPQALRSQAKLVMMVGTTLALLLLPMRLVQTEKFVRPFASASIAIESIDADVVLIDDWSGWYLQDLVRNDPYLRNRPIIARLGDARDHFTALGEMSVVVIDQSSLSSHGIHPEESPPKRGSTR